MDLALSSAPEGIEAHLRALAKFQSMPGTPQGCLLVQGPLVPSEESAPISKALCDSRAYGVQMIRACVERGVQQHELLADTDIDALARYFGTVSQGISVQAASGTPRDELDKTITIGMTAWPLPAERPRKQACSRDATLQ